jgi:diacylglycerol kinase (ATP)
MIHATLVHNPKAGEGSYSKEELVTMLHKHGIEPDYRSIKEEGWEKPDPQSEFMIVAGGDGTVRKAALKLLELDIVTPIALLPAGTANNIAASMNLPEDEESLISRWKAGSRQRFDTGKLENFPHGSWFLESFGFGVFPLLMQQMKQQDDDELDTPEKKLDRAIRLMHEIVSTHEPFYCELEIDGSDHSGDFYLVEVMNTPSIGPNLVLAPQADPGDGELEVVLIPRSQKDSLLGYLSNRMAGEETPNWFDIRKAKKVRLQTREQLAHTDDQLIQVDGASAVEISVAEGCLTFLA